MAVTGRLNSLWVARHTEFGLYLDGTQHGEILLPKRYVPKDWSSEMGGWLNVFIYLDSDDCLIATTQTPKVQVGGLASLKVVEINRIGLLLDWSLLKDLLLPHSEEKRPLQVGGYCVVYVYLDKRTNRITATARLDRQLDNLLPRCSAGQTVDLLVVERTEMGFKAIIEGKHRGLIHKNEAFKLLCSGMREQGYIKESCVGGKIALSLQPVGAEAVVKLSQQISVRLLEAGGSLPLSDKSSPEDTHRLFGVSGGTSKKAIGGFYKEGLTLTHLERIELPRWGFRSRLEEWGEVQASAAGADVAQALTGTRAQLQAGGRPVGVPVAQLQTVLLLAKETGGHFQVLYCAAGRVCQQQVEELADLQLAERNIKPPDVLALVEADEQGVAGIQRGHAQGLVELCDGCCFIEFHGVS